MKKTILAISFILTASCKNEAQNQRPLTELESRGKAVYMSTCTACHNPNPRLAGSIGPDLAFSNLDLVQMRVEKAAYPAGYKPKRSSRIMPAFPQLAGDVKAIHAYLNSFPK